MEISLVDRQKKAWSTLVLCLTDNVFQKVIKEKTSTCMLFAWDNLYMAKTLTISSKIEAIWTYNIGAKYVYLEKCWWISQDNCLPSFRMNYVNVMGSIMYMVIDTRQDIAHLEGVVSRYMGNLVKSH